VTRAPSPSPAGETDRAKLLLLRALYDLVEVARPVARDVENAARERNRGLAIRYIEQHVAADGNGHVGEKEVGPTRGLTYSSR